MTLSGKQIESVRALAEILIPPGGTLEAGAGEAGVAERVASWVEGMPPKMQRRFRLLVRAWDDGSVLSPKYRRCFRKLSRADQEEWVSRAYRSRRLDRKLPLSYLKQIILLAYASSPQIEDRIGYDYTCRLEGEPHGRRPETEPPATASEIPSPPPPR